MDMRDYPTLCLNSIEVKEIRFYCWPTVHSRGRSMGAHPARFPLKLEKIWFFGVKSWFFTRNTPKYSRLPPQLEKIRFFCVKLWFFTPNTPQIFAPPSTIGKNMIFLRKIVIFHTKYPKHFSASLRSAHFFLSAPPPLLEILDPPLIISFPPPLLIVYALLGPWFC